MDVVNLAKGEEPSVYPNQVVIRRTVCGFFQVSGSSNRYGRPEYLLTPHLGSFDEAVGAAKTWGDQQGIAVVHTYRLDEEECPPKPPSMSSLVNV